MFHKSSENIVVLALVKEVERTAGKLLDDVFLSKNVHLTTEQQIHERADKHLGFVLGSLDVDDDAVTELHHFPEHSVGILIQLLEEDLFGRAEERVDHSIIALQEDIPLTHHQVG